MSLSSLETPKLNLLVAYPYMTKRVVDELKSHADTIRFVLDSGAFTAWKAGKSISIDDYCKFIDSLQIKPWRYFTLDVIGDPDGTARNYEIMLSRGYNPVPIFTRGEDIKKLEMYYKSSDVVGIGGLVGTPKNKGFINGIMKHINGRKVHWLGFTSAEFIKHYQPYMCDSSSWLSPLKYGQMSLYDCFGRFVKVKKSDFSKQPSHDVLRLLKEFDVSPQSLSVVENWKNSGSGKCPVEMVAFRSAVKYMLDVEKNIGTYVFMAVASDWQVRMAVEAFNFWESKK